MNDPDTIGSDDVGAAATVPAIDGGSQFSSASPTHEVDVDSLLSEFDQATKAPAGEGDAPPAPIAPEAPQPAGLDWSKIRGFSDSDMLSLAMETDRQRIMMDAFLEQHQRQLLQQQERADFSEVLSEAAPWLEDLPGIGDPQAEAKRWLLSEVQLDPRLAEAWQRRRDSAEHQRYAVGMINRAFKKMRGELERRPDPELTADKWAVAALMRGGSAAPPANKPPDYSWMTDSQLQSEKDRLFAAG